jgi:hypothetical protein
MRVELELNLVARRPSLTGAARHRGARTRWPARTFTSRSGTVRILSAGIEGGGDLLYCSLLIQDAPVTRTFGEPLSKAHGFERTPNRHVVLASKARKGHRFFERQRVLWALPTTELPLLAHRLLDAAHRTETRYPERACEAKHRSHAVGHATAQISITKQTRAATAAQRRLHGKY